MNEAMDGQTESPEEVRLQKLTARLLNATCSSCDVENDESMSAVINSMPSILAGESVISTPACALVQFLGTIAIHPGDVRGATFKFRTYNVESQLLAAGHVLPWKICAKWRYSQLRQLLVINLKQILAYDEDLWEHYVDLIKSFPSKSWSNRLSIELAHKRSRDLQLYVANAIELTTKLLMKDSENNLLLREILGLFTYRLLNLKPDFQDSITELTANIGGIISATPKDHCVLDRGFSVAPQQGL